MNPLSALGSLASHVDHSECKTRVSEVARRGPSLPSENSYSIAYFQCDKPESDLLEVEWVLDDAGGRNPHAEDVLLRW